MWWRSRLPDWALSSVGFVDCAAVQRRAVFGAYYRATKGARVCAVGLCHRLISAMFSFGASQNPNNQQNASFGQSTFQPAQQMQQPQQIQQQQPDPIERLTRVSDLPNDAQTLIEQLNQHILQQISISDQFGLNEEGLGETVQSVSLDVAEIQKRSTRTQVALSIDQRNLESLRDQVHRDAENARISTRFMDGIRNGTLNVRGSADYILQYFYDTVDTIERDLQAYNKLVNAIEKHVTHVRNQRIQQDAETLIATLKAQHEAFMQITAKIAVVHEQTTQVVQ